MLMLKFGNFAIENWLLIYLSDIENSCQNRKWSACQYQKDIRNLFASLNIKFDQFKLNLDILLEDGIELCRLYTFTVRRHK